MLQNLRPIEIVAIVVIIVLLFGAKKLPELAKGVGESLRILKKEARDTDPIAAEAGTTMPADVREEGR
ncbi:MAG: twin-arginine translocase TatA/TatE family subunit [Actinomyces sp.]|nr:twin-arginine translocase TatA/TatE family subunit [Actinomyces sp.]MDN6429353.1 twin-arginine translocase TatA/TatE family subunit [Propionibacterium sp.]MDN6566983.1 twin-arginine translocase TatA/TatE family subunit [Actinomyces sp.]MDN6795158.1 twin-arginine translocase TatA/TatE family subunit [Propionibacterium sp.]